MQPSQAPNREYRARSCPETPLPSRAPFGEFASASDLLVRQAYTSYMPTGGKFRLGAVDTVCARLGLRWVTVSLTYAVVRRLVRPRSVEESAMRHTARAFPWLSLSPT